jgi:hypothetical protein
MNPKATAWCGRWRLCSAPAKISSAPSARAGDTVVKRFEADTGARVNALCDQRRCVVSGTRDQVADAVDRIRLPITLLRKKEEEDGNRKRKQESANLEKQPFSDATRAVNAAVAVQQILEGAEADEEEEDLEDYEDMILKGETWVCGFGEGDRQKMPRQEEVAAAELRAAAAEARAVEADRKAADAYSKMLTAQAESNAAKASAAQADERARAAEAKLDAAAVMTQAATV